MGHGTLPGIPTQGFMWKDWPSFLDDLSDDPRQINPYLSCTPFCPTSSWFEAKANLERARPIRQRPREARDWACGPKVSSRTSHV